MEWTLIDGVIVAATLLLAIGVGLWASRRAGRDPEQYFLSGRDLPGWMLGLSMVATTFAADTPGLVTELVRTQGVAGNWAWWAFLLTGMLTVFFFAKLWRRSGVRTDLEFYELRYSGVPAAALRVFRALYLGVVFNVIVMAVVSVAAIKIGQVVLGVTPLTTLVCGGVAALLLSATGGLRAVVLTDCVLFGVAMTGAFAAAYFALDHPDVGGLTKLVTSEAITAKLPLLPAWDWSTPASRELLVTTLLVPLAVQWWSVWYPGAEPGGGGYLAQRMLAAKNEDHALGAVLLFNTFHYALRPWPWIIVALASMAVYPDLADLKRAFPAVDDARVGHDLAYPAMIHCAPSGWRGLIIASLAAAYISTISTHLNWGASYVTGDFYQRMVDPGAGPRRLVVVGRVATLGMMLLASLLALWLQTARQGFDLLLSVGAGTGLIYVLRWYWWRINATAEIVAMASSVTVTAYFQLGPDHGLARWETLCLSVGVTTALWLAAMWLTPPEPKEKLEAFYARIHPAGPGWRPVAACLDRPMRATVGGESITLNLMRMALGCVGIYAALFSVGRGLYGNAIASWSLAAAAVGCAAALVWTYLGSRSASQGSTE